MAGEWIEGAGLPKVDAGQTIDALLDPGGQIISRKGWQRPTLTLALSLQGEGRPGDGSMALARADGDVGGVLGYARAGQRLVCD